MTKQEKIQEAYGTSYEELQDLICENGWVSYIYERRLWDRGIEEDRKNNMVRPKSLAGIEDYYTFKDVIGFESYQLNKQGVLISKSRVSTQKNGKKYTVKEKIMKPQIDNTGYIVFGLRNIRKETKKVYLHRTLCELFLPNPYNKPCVNHKDGVKYNNALSNLEWCTYQENNKHAFDNNLNSTIGSRLKGKTGEKCHNYGKRNKKIYSKNKVYNNIKEASEDLNLTVGYLYQCLCGSVSNTHNLSYQPIEKPQSPIY